MSLFAALCALLGCQSRTADFPSVSAEEFARFLTDTSVVCLDVRTADEYAGGHLKNSLNIDMQQNDFEERIKREIPVGSTVAVYCRSGRRSRRAATLLVRYGFRVVELADGYIGWQKAGMAVER